MPFKSRAQQKYFHYLASKGKLPKSVDLDEYDKKTDFGDLPEHMAFGGEIDEEHDMSPKIIHAGSEYDTEDHDSDVDHEDFRQSNSSGEPHTNDEYNEEDDMEYMSKGGMVKSKGSGQGAFMRAMKRSRGRV